MSNPKFHINLKCWNTYHFKLNPRCRVFWYSARQEISCLHMETSFSTPSSGKTITG